MKYTLFLKRVSKLAAQGCLHTSACITTVVPAMKVTLGNCQKRPYSSCTVCLHTSACITTVVPAMKVTLGNCQKRPYSSCTVCLHTSAHIPTVVPAIKNALFEKSVPTVAAQWCLHTTT
ncbi:hypothetical protein V1264_019671 [Littorina saxatilis]|uniref:Uncharacterized protein n=1 Tax=Littorina saxatilis TaxID=31220 RepID=A0AAN9GFM9_9CAEN